MVLPLLPPLTARFRPLPLYNINFIALQRGLSSLGRAEALVSMDS